jgi:GntR family transcriptional regulator
MPATVHGHTSQAASSTPGEPPSDGAALQAIAPGDAGMPLFRAVQRALLLAVQSGRFAPGAALPSEAALAQAFGVSLGTVRRAVDDLVAGHVLVRRQGRGTFVATHSSERFLFQFFHVERSDGLREAPQVELLAFERTRLEDEPATALGLRAGEPAYAIENRLRLQGRPVVHDRLLLPAALFRGLTEKRLRERPGTLYQLYQSGFGITVVRAQERLAAVAADRAAARVLGVAPGAPVLQVRRVAIALAARPVEYRVSILHTAQHEYVNLLTSPQ